MKVMLENSVFHPRWIGGAEAVVYLLARELSAQGIEVDVLACTGRRAGPARLATRTLPEVSGTIYEAPLAGLVDLLPAAGQPRPGRLWKAAHHALGAHSARWRRWAAQALRLSRPDVLHTHTIVGLTPAIWRAARGLGVPVVHTLHDYHLLCARTTLLRSDGSLCERSPLPCRALQGAKLAAARGVAVVTAPSRYALERHLAAGGFSGARAEVVRNAPDPPPEGAISARRARWASRGAGAGGAGLTALYLGQLNVHKGVPQLLTALAGLPADPSLPGLRFAFAGAGPLAGEVAAFCAQRGDRCRYLGPVAGAAKEELLAASDVLVLPSRWHDVAPMVILEAFARGLPVVGARRGGIPELVIDGETGLLIEPEPAALADALAHYARDPALLQRHAEAAAAAASLYTRERQLQAYLQIYRDLAASRR